MNPVRLLCRRKYVVSALMLGGFLTTSSAIATTTIATVSQVLLLSDANLVYVYPTGGISGGPSCATGAAYYSFSYTRTMGSAYLAALLAAKASGTSVTFYGTAACTDQSVSETLGYFSVN